MNFSMEGVDNAAASRITLSGDFSAADWRGRGYAIVDVRSPAEYAKGHLPGSANLPLFGDAERAAIGTCYKLKGKQAAISMGLDFVGPRMSSMVNDAKLYNSPLLLYCWRGGMRSASVAWLLHMAGMEVTVINGGYKAYRTRVLEYFERCTLKWLVLGGRTGTGKTVLLNLLSDRGEPVIDLERIACHKGSAFGWIGESKQPTNEMFENLLFELMHELVQHHTYAWIENESRSVGSNFIPLPLWEQMKRSPLLNISRDDAYRLQHLLRCYDHKDADALVVSFEKIAKRLGLESAAKAIDFVRQGKLEAAAKIALDYYDKCYDYNLDNNVSPEIVNMDFMGCSDDEVVNGLIEFRLNWYGQGDK